MSIIKINFFKINSIVEFSPSVGWFLMMLWPFTYQYSTFSPIAKFPQLVIIAIIFSALFAADFLCYTRSLSRLEVFTGAVNSAWFYIVGLSFAGFSALHIYLMPEIPFIALLTGDNVSSSSLSLLREQSGKLLQAPAIIKYLFMWSLEIFAPMLIVVSLWFGYWRRALFFLFVAIFYALTTIAKSPLILLCLTCYFMLTFLPTRLKKQFSIAWLCAVFSIIIFSSALIYSDKLDYMRSVLGNEASIPLSMKQDDPRRWFTLGDVSRLDLVGVSSESRAMTIAVNTFYRLWLTPADVSHRWYQYFTYVRHPLGVEGFIPKTSTEDQILAPSRRVGLWAYKERFPLKYGDTVNAYASFDADAFARAGYLGVFIATLLLVFVRIAAGFVVTNSIWSLISYGVLLCFLTIMPSSASLQAILGAHGLAFIFVYLLVSYWLQQKNKKS